jgi:hypothetical protein
MQRYAIREEHSDLDDDDDGMGVPAFWLCCGLLGWIAVMAMI